MRYTLPELPYAYNALEPHIDARTMEVHYKGHHAAYVTNLNAAIEGHHIDIPDVEDLMTALNTLPEEIRPAVRNNGGGHANHSLFWTLMTENGGGRPGRELLKVMDEQLGGFETFTKQFTAAAMGRFGSGWAWLCLDAGHKLLIESTPNQDSPLMFGHIPILGLDVWEHAYYLKYQNRRAEYVKAFFNVINWDTVKERYQAAVNKPAYAGAR